MMVDFPDPLCAANAVDFPASMLIEKPWNMITSGLAGYAKGVNALLIPTF